MIREPQDPLAWRKTMAPRLGILAGLFAVCVVALVVRLVVVQIHDRPFYVKWQKDQSQSLQKVPGPRGDIVDRNGKILAMTVLEPTLKFDTSKVADPAKTAALLCQALGDCTPADRAQFVEQLSLVKKTRVLRRQLDEAQVRRVTALGLEGVVLSQEPHRWYPKKELAANILGCVGLDENGLYSDGQYGLERRYNSILSGRPGRYFFEMMLETVRKDDGKKVSERKPFSRVIKPEVPGRSLQLTIDENLQFLAERELKAAVLENKARGGSVVILDPFSGEILAMASYPTANANEFGEAPQEARKNRPVESVYEPGSTFKIVTATAALDGKVWTPDELVDTGNGTIRIPGRAKPIDEAQGHRYGTLSFSDVIVKSSNVGAVLIGRRIGSSLMRSYVEAFGFGTRLATDFRPAESPGIYARSAQWSESTLASRSMGYEISVTALQMAVAASVVANGGELVQPRVVRAVIDGDRQELVPRTVVRRVMSPETAATLTTIMEGVVERGTGKSAIVKYFTVAGKTGTSNKSENGHYIEEYNTSFVGFVPSRKPAMTIVVHIDAPRGPNKPFGGTVAAPVFGRLADAALHYLGVPPTIDPPQPVLVARRDTAPAPVPAPVTIVPALAPIGAGQIVLPDLRGMSGREALRVLSRIGIVPHVVGDGVVVEQAPAPGTPVDFGAQCRLGLARAIPGIQP
jgi:cell division protein FtsI (penicillin-binding protein 3)